MRSLAVTQENLENQRATVKEEKRLRVDNQPYAPTFRNVGAYGWLSTRSRFSSFTVARWFSRFSWVTASERIRSASSQRARGSEERRGGEEGRSRWAPDH